MSDVLVFVEHADGEAERLSREALALAGSLATATGGGVEAFLVGPGAADAAAGLGRLGVRTAHVVGDERLAAYAPSAWAAALVELVDRLAPAAVVAGGSDRGNEVLAHVAARTGRPMAANVVSVTVGDPWRLTRQRWAGSLLEDATVASDVHVLTVAPHVVPVAEVGEVGDGGSAPGAPLARAAVVAFQPTVSERDLVVRVTGREAPAAGAISLTDARVVVGGGRGVGSAEAFATLEELATLLGGAVGGSRVVTSNGWRPHSDQIGQTGLRIAPDLYVACGISGAIQHIVGCKAAKRILAINTDPDSPIMGVADYAVIGDLHQVIPAISAEIRRRAADRA
jgi:electron transfer flavoprotein alpha subunit